MNNKREKARTLWARTKGSPIISSLKAGVVSGGTLASMRASIKAGECPFCGRTGFVSIANHVYGTHGLLRRELGDMLMFTNYERICSNELGDLREVLSSGMNPRRVPSQKSRQISKKGQQLMTETAIKNFAKQTGEQKRAAGSKGGMASKEAKIGMPPRPRPRRVSGGESQRKRFGLAPAMSATTLRNGSVSYRLHLKGSSPIPLGRDKQKAVAGAIMVRAFRLGVWKDGSTWGHAPFEVARWE